MPNFKLECEHRNVWDETLEVRNTSEFQYEQLQDVIGAFEDFLRGCGYVFDGHLEIVEEETTKGCGGGCSGCKSDEVNFDREAQESRVRFQHTVDSLMNPPTFRANEDTINISDFNINLGDYGGATESIVVSPGIDTISITGSFTGKSDSCETCGLPKTVMKGHQCWDDNCPKGTW